MAKNNLNDWSTDSSQNTDLSGTPVLGSAKPSVMITWIRKMMAQVADVVQGNVPLLDSFSVRDADDPTKTFRVSAAKIPTSTERVAEGEKLYRHGAPKVTIYNTAGSFTHTFQEATHFYRVEGCGGGAAGTSCNGASDFACAPGGCSGHYGYSDFVTRPDDGTMDTAAVVVGAGGLPYNSPATNGGDTTFDDGNDTFRFKGGVTDTAPLTASATVNSAIYPSQASLHASLAWSTQSGGMKGSTGLANDYSGDGGSSPYGPGGRGTQRIQAGETTGNPGAGNGSGGAGAVRRNVGSSGNTQGGAGAPGILIVMEY